jgi:dTDP-4-dehydrorhamnose reductase
MLGHVVYNHFKENGYEVFATTQTDDGIQWDAYLNLEKIEDIIQEVKPDAVVNCIGILNQVCEANKPLAVKLNSLLPHYIDSLSEKYNLYRQKYCGCRFSLNGDENGEGKKEG